MNGPTRTVAAAERILEVHRRAFRARGGAPALRVAARWYHREGDGLRRLAEAWGVAPGRVVAAAVALAPQQRWERVLDCLRELSAGRPFLPGFLRRSITRAEAALAGAYPEDLFPARTSPKSSDFYAALRDPDGPARYRPVVDVHAARVAGIPLRRRGDYPEVAGAYVLAAEELGDETTPLGLQALTWTAVRDWGVRLPSAVVPAR